MEVERPDDDRRVTLELARTLAGTLAACSGDSVDAVLLYGSHLLGTAPDRHSALDLVVVVDDYGAFYRALSAAGESHRPPWLMAALARVLPPNVVAFAPRDAAALAKCLIVSRADLVNGLSERARDHFLRARLVQRVAVVFARSALREAWMEDLLARARAGVLDWIGPFLDEPFDAESLGHRILEVCYRAEIRPEAANRADTVFRAQREHFREHLLPVLESALAKGVLLRSGEGYRFGVPPSSAWRRRLRWYFFRSKVRVTARWAKHPITFDNWLPYVVRKVERRTGLKVELTERERRWPVVFLWPRVIRVFLARPESEAPPREPVP
jgi:hypothetical protein